MWLLHARDADHGTRHRYCGCPMRIDARIREELAGNLCRCTGYVGIVRAIARVLESRRSAARAD